MASETLDFNDLNPSQISANGFDVSTYDLEQFFSPYNLYVEERVSNDTPKDSQANLYKLYDAGINNLSEDDWKITIGEKITSQTQIYCTNNYNTVISNFSSTTGGFDEIHYDSLISELDGLENMETSAEMTAKVIEWINDYVNDLTINQNPENSDDSNLILTQALTSDIQTITENILKKVFRNLIQLVRFKRDYRMYGPSSTIYGNCYASGADCQKYTAVPASCFSERANNYMVGKKAYGDSIANVGEYIANSVWHIAPSSSYALAKHVHGVSVDIGSLPTTIEAGHNVLLSASEASGYHTHLPKYTNDADGAGTSWEKEMDHIDGVVDWNNGNTENHVEWSGHYKYFWNSNSSHCKLVSRSNWGNNPWSKSDIKLPTFSTRVWVWANKDTATNIENPTEFITAT